MYKFSLLKWIFIILMIPSIAFSADFFVNVDSGSNSNSGMSSEDAWETITYALSQVEGTKDNQAIIHIAAGLYNPASEEEFPLEMKDYVTLMGNDKETTIIDAAGTTGIVMCGNKSDETMITGATFENLTFQNGATLFGGGIFCFRSSPVFKSCIIKNNTAYSGGGIYCEESHSIIITNCEFSGNFGNESGGAICCYFCNNPIIENAKFENNSAIDGAGVYCFGSAPNVINCQFSQNIASDNGGGLSCHKSTPNFENCTFKENKASKGGGLYFFEKVSNQATFTNCEIKKNFAEDGGGIYCDNSSPKFVNCLVASNNIIESNMKIPNQGYDRGGGIFCNESSPRFSNCTIADNSAKDAGGIYSMGSKSPTLINCIGWGNGEEPMTTKVSVTFSDIEGESLFPGIGNKNEDPLFISGPSGEYYLSQTAAGQKADSPCIDKGNDSAERLGLDTMTTRTDGVTDSSIVDMGYHYSPQFDIIFNLSILPSKERFTTGYNLQLLLDLKTTESSFSCDVYFVMLNPAGLFFSFFDWTSGIKPFAKNFEFPKDLSIVNMTILDITIPNAQPPVQMVGSYTFAIAAFDTGTVNFKSNLATISFQVE
ncbi:DUF1565 domain-containing protein [bacterium]|nr:DUF1565 domain-containing protein [bacterium]